MTGDGERWHVDIGDEGWLIENQTTLECWGLNKNYGHPEALGKLLNAIEADRDAKAALLDAAVKELEAANADAEALAVALIGECEYCLAGHPFEDASEEDYDEEYPRHYFEIEFEYCGTPIKQFIWRYCHIEGAARVKALAALAAHEARIRPPEAHNE